jgi:mannose-6-phosphate isomerase-like protein (cupin superfamily)
MNAHGSVRLCLGAEPLGGTLTKRRVPLPVPEPGDRGQRREGTGQDKATAYANPVAFIRWRERNGARHFLRHRDPILGFRLRQRAAAVRFTSIEGARLFQIPQKFSGIAPCLRSQQPRNAMAPSFVPALNPNQQEQAVAIFNKDMVELANKNTFWQKEVYRDPKVQIVLMSIPAGEEIGAETHPADQTTFIVTGEAQVVIDGHSTKAGPNHMVVVPKGSEHNIINKGSGELKLFSVYAPPAEPEGAAFKTKEEAEEAEKGILTKAAEKVKEAVGR